MSGTSAGKAAAAPRVSMQELLAGCGLGCTMAWVSMSFKSMNIFANSVDAEQTLDTVYLISIISVAATLILCAIFDKKTDRILTAKPTRYIVACGVAISTLLMMYAGAQGSTAIAISVISGVCSGICSGLLLLYFGVIFSMFSLRSNVIGAATAAIFSTLLFLLSLLFQPLESCIFSASMPLLALVFLETSKDNLIDPTTANVEIRTSERDDWEIRQDCKLWQELVVKLSLCTLIVGFANELARTFYMQMGVLASSRIGWYITSQAISSLAVTIILVVVSLALISSAKEPRFKSCYRILYALLILGVLLLPFQPLQEKMLYLPSSLNAAAYACFGMFAWMLTITLCQQFPMQRVRTFSLIRAGWAVGPLCGLLLGRYLIAHYGPTIHPTLIAAVIAIGALLLLNTLVYTESDLSKTVRLMPLERQQRFKHKCERVIKQYGLSDREGEIMIMLAKGRNLPYIQDQLSLSKGTVSTHRQHIYQKLDIHSQQELINLIDANVPD